MKRGDFVLALDRRKLTGFLVPGFMTHAGACVNYSNSGNFEIAEMTHHNFTKSYLFDFCKEADRVLLCECVDMDFIDRLAMCNAVMSFENANYDIDFILGVKSLYCSELVYEADQMAGQKMKVDLSDLAGLGRPYISPDGLLFAKNTRVIYDSDEELTDMTGPQAEAFCKMKGYIK